MSKKRAQFDISMLATEELTSAEAPGAGSVSERTLRAGGGNKLSQTLSETSTPAITAPPVSLKITLGGSPTVIDLTAVAAISNPPTATRTVSMSGLRLIGYDIRAAGENADPITVGPGASSSTYDLFGAGLDQIFEPGFQSAGCFRGVASTLPPVSGSAKNIEVSGTSGDIIYIDLFFGT